MSTITGLNVGLTLTTGEAYGLSTDIVLTNLDGWEGGGSIRRTSTPRLNAHGDFAERGWRGPNLLTISGDATFGTASAASQFVIDLEANLADGTAGILTVTDTDLGLTRHMHIYLESGVDITHTCTDVAFTFMLMAPDPVKLGETETVAGTTVTWRNTGTAPGRTAFELRGNYPTGFTITEAGGRTLAFTKPVDATAKPLVIDCTTGTVTQGATNLSAALTKREWTAVERGVTVTFTLTAPDATNPALTLKGTPAWH